MPENIPTKNIPLSTIPVKSTIGRPIGNTGYGTSKYDTQVNYQDALYNLEEFRHNNQSNLDVLGNATAHFAGSAVNAALEIPAIAFGALKAPFVGWNSLAKGNGFVNAEVDAFNAYYDNEISRQVVDPINQWFQDTFKVYSSQKQKDSNFFSYENLTSGHFLDALLSGGGYTAGSFLTGAALTKAFGLTKMAATGTKVGESAESLIAEAANTAKKSIPLNLRSQLAIGTIMAGMESSLEARQTKDQILQELKDSNLTDAQKQDIAESGSLANFAFNMAILVPTNSLVFGRLIRPGGDAIESGIKTTFNTEGKVIEKQIANKYLRTVAKIIKNPITESLFEEGGQEYLQFASNQAINDYLDNKYNGNNASILRSIGSALYDGIATKEGLENTVIGGLMGVVAGGAAHIRNGKEEADRKKFQLDYINKNLPKALAVIKDKILDADRSITYQQNMDKNIIESDKENKFNYYNNKHSALVSLVQQHLASGTLGILVDRIKGLKTASKEEINKLFGNEVTQSDLERWDSEDTINSLVRDINNIKDIHENVQRILPNPYNIKTQPKEYLAFKDLQNLLTHTASTIDNTTARIHTLNQQLNRFGITFNNILYNNLTKEEKKDYLESTKEEIQDTNPVHHAHLNKELNDILNLNQRKEVFTAAYKTLSSEKGSKETLEKISILQKEKEQPKPEVKKEVKPPIPPNPKQEKKPEEAGEYNIQIEKQGDLGNKINVKLKSGGIWEDVKGNTYTREQGYYIPGETNTKRNEDPKQVLYGTDHFLIMWFQGLADNRGFSTKTKALIQKIAKLPNWKDFISVVVSQKQVKVNKEEEQKNLKKTLYGDKEIKLQGRYDIDILLNITDPETGEVPEEGREITGINNPNLFAFSNGVAIDFNDPQWDLANFNKYFANADESSGSKPFTQAEFEEFKANWNALKNFNDAVIKWYSEQNKEEVSLPKEFIDFILTGSAVFNSQHIRSLDSEDFGDTFKNSPIINARYPNTSTNGISLEGEPDPSTEISEQMDEKYQNSYFALAKLVNGLKRWIRIVPKSKSPEDVLQRIKNVKAKLEQPNLTETQATEITDELNFWISSKPGNVIKFLHNKKLAGKYQLILGTGTNYKVQSRTVVPDSALQDEQSLIKFINTAASNSKIQDINVSDFKESVSTDVTSIDQFETSIQPEILNKYGILFTFGTDKVIKDVVQKEEEQKPEVSVIPITPVISVVPIIENTDSELEKQIKEITEILIQEGYNDVQIKEEIEEVKRAYYESKKDKNSGKTKMYSDEYQLSTEPKTYEEVIARLREQIPSGIPIERIQQILDSLNVKGIPVGIFRDAAVYISEKMGYSDADHEAFHAIFNSVLSVQEQERYLKAKAKELNYTPEQLNQEVQDLLAQRPDLIIQLKNKEITLKDVQNLVYEEKIADDYADKRNNKELNQPKSWKQAIFNLFDKIINFFTGNVKIFDLFEKIDRGAFVNSSIRNNPNSRLVKTKLVGGLTAEESRNLIALVTAKYTTFGNKDSVTKIIQDLIQEYNPYSKSNLTLVQSRETEYEKEQLKKFLKKYYFALNSNQALIQEEASKYIKYLNYDPEALNEDDLEARIDDIANDGYDRLDSEVNTLHRVSAEIKAFIGSTIYKTTFYGKEIEVAVNFARVYNKLLSVLTNQSAEKVLSTIKAISSKSGENSKEIQALYNKLRTEKGYHPVNSPFGSDFNNRMFLTRFVKQFELARLPFVSVFKGSDGKLLIKKLNKHDAGVVTFDHWSTVFTARIEDKLAGDQEFRRSLRYDFNQLVSKVQGKDISDSWVLDGKNVKASKLKNSTIIRSVFNKIGIELEKEYLEVLFDEETPDSIILKELLEKQQTNFSVQDILSIQGILFSSSSNSENASKERNPFLNTDTQKRLMGIATGSSQYSNDFIIPNYRTSDNKSRYTYVPYNEYLQSIVDLQNKFKNLQDFDFKESDYLKYNALVNNSNKKVSLQNIQNLELVYIGDSTFEEGKTYKDSTDQDILRVLHALFQNRTPEGFYFTAPSIIADKRSFYGVQVPFHNYYENDEFTPEIIRDLKNIFTQEYKRIQGNFPNTKSGKDTIWLYMPMFNDNPVLDKIKSEKDINLYFESDILPILREFFNTAVQNHKVQGIEFEKGELYQFVLNNFVNNISIQQLTEGDLSQLKFKKLDTWQKTYNKIFSERFKRESSLNASGKDRGAGDDVVQYTKDTEAWINKETGNIVWEDPKDTENYHKAINPDDGQVWQSAMGRLRDLDSMGKLTENNARALHKLNGLVFDEKGNPLYPTKEELKDLDLISFKDVTSGFDTEGNRVYYKMSIGVLIPWELGYWNGKEWAAKKGKEQGFEKWKELNSKYFKGTEQDTDLLIPISASKVFSGESGKQYKVPRKYRREQVLKESKKGTKVPWLTQIQQLIDFGLLDSNDKTQVLRTVIQDLQVQLRNNTFNFLQDQLVNPDGKLKEDLSYFLDKAASIIEESTSDLQSIELIQRKLFNFSHNRAIMEEIFMSHFKSAFQHKLNGDKLTMVSPIIYRTVRDTQGEVIPQRNLNSEEYKDSPVSDLKITWENGEPLGEIVISAWTAKKLGLKIGDTVVQTRVPTQGYNFMGRSKIVDILPEYYGSIIISAPQTVLYAGQDFDDDSLYIFTKERYNTLRGEIFYGEEKTLEEKWEGYKNWYVNNNPDVIKYLKSLISSNKELQGLQNIDLLLDTSNQRSVQIYDSLVEQTLRFFNLISSIQEFQDKGMPESQGALNNELINNLERIIAQPELEKYFKQASNTDETKKTKERIEKILGTDNVIYNMFTPDGLMKAWLDNTSSNTLRGSAVNTQTAGALLTKDRVDLNPEFWIEYNGTTYKTFNTPDQETYDKNNRSSEKVSTTIDNSKDPMASTFGWTKNNISVFSYLNQLGISIEDGDGILAVQPAILEAAGLKITKLPGLIKDYISKLDDPIVPDDLTSEELWSALKNPNKESQEFLRTQIKALKMFFKAAQIAEHAYNISRLNTLNRTIGKNFDDAQNFLDAWDNLTVPKKDQDGNPIIPPFDSRNILLNEKNIVNNVNNLKKVFAIGSQLFVSRTESFIKIQNKLLEFLKGNPQENRKAVRADLSSYLQMQLFKVLTGNINIVKLVTELKGTAKSDLITSKYKELLKYDEFKYNKFIRYIKPVEYGEPGNNTPLAMLKFDSVTTPTKEFTEVLIDSISSMLHSDNPEIQDFVHTLFNYQALNAMRFGANSFMKFMPVQLLKDLGNKYKILGDELAKQSPSEEVIKKLTGKNLEELEKEFIANFINNSNNYRSKVKYVPSEFKPLREFIYSPSLFTQEYMKPWLYSHDANVELSTYLAQKLKPLQKNQTSENKEELTDEESDFVDEIDLENPEESAKLEKIFQSMIKFEEHSKSDYPSRTRENAGADATIAIAMDFNTAGERLTKKSVLEQNKKYIPILLSKSEDILLDSNLVDSIVQQLNEVNAKSLNIAGNGIYTYKDKFTQVQLDGYVQALIQTINEHPDLKNKIQSIRTGGQTGIDEAGAKAGVRLGIPTTVLAPKGYTFRNIHSKDISNEKEFKDRFNTEDESNELFCLL